MIIYKKIYEQYKAYWIFMVLIVFMTAIAGLCNQFNVLELFIFICFQIFCIFIPGIAIMILLPIRNLREVERVLFSYASGYILTMLLNTLIMLTIGKNLLKVAFALVAIISIFIVWYHLKKSGQREVITESDDRMWIWTVLAVFFVMLTVSLRWKIPYAGGSNSYEGDFLTWTGNIVGLKSENFLSAIMGFRYHYLGAFQQSVVSNVTGIPVIRVASCYSHIEETVLLALSSYALVYRMIKNKKAQFVALLLMLFSTGFEKKAVVSYIWHIYLVSMSYNIAQSFGVMIILLVLMQLEEEFDVNKLIVMTCFLMCCTGTKGATGAVIFCGIFIACLYLFFCRKEKKMAFLYAFFTAIGFGLVYMYLMPTAQVFSNNATEYYQPEQLSVAIGEIEENDVELVAIIHAGIEWMRGYVKKFIYINPWTFIPAVIFVVYSAIRKTIKKEHILLFLVTVIGMSLSYIIVFYGHSEMYFALTVFPFAAVLSGCLVEKVFSDYMTGRMHVLFSGIICLAVVVFTVSADYDCRFREWFVSGIYNLYLPDMPSQAIGTQPYAQSEVTHDECQAYQWIFENTDENVTLISDRVNSTVYIFTERSVYYDTDHEACFNGDEKILEKYADLGIDYIIQNKYNSPMFTCSEGMGEIVFENDGMAVYCLTEN